MILFHYSLIFGIWGDSDQRVRASFLLFLYPLAEFLCMLLALMAMYHNIGSTGFTMIFLSDGSLDGQKLIWLAFFLSFAVKTPMVPSHMWLPRDHAEAPLAGSIPLAGLVLKLATT